MDVFMFFFLAFQVTEASEKLLVFRQLYNNRTTLACAAKDNGDALVWNTNSKSYYESHKLPNAKAFQSIYEKGNQFDCKDHYEECSWTKGEWNITESLLMPMGPVLDNRWEDFREYNNFESSTDYIQVHELSIKGALAFSVRGTTDAHIFLCETNDFYKSFCYWIIIGSCVDIGVYPSGTENNQTTLPLCRQEADSNIHNSILSPIEWKHFVLRWDGDRQNVTLYDNKKMLSTYVYPKVYTNDLQKFYLYHKNTNGVYFRYHTYDYFYTKQSNTFLSYVWGFPENNPICFRLSIGLCAKCSMEINFRTTRGLKFKEKVIVNASATIHGLPTWQHVKVNMTIKEKLNMPTQIHIIPKIEDEDDGEGFWAVRDITRCPSPEKMKISIMIDESNNDLLTNQTSWSDLICQRISYNDSEVVSAGAKVEVLEIDDYNCPNGEMCSIACDSFYQNFHKFCKNIAICEARGCTCYPGFTGDNCDTSCSESLYGYGCRETCGQCLDPRCDYKTGLCTPQACNNTTVYHIPPYCKIAIDNPPAPTIDFVNETYVRASINVKNEYKETAMDYVFLINNNTKTKPKYVDKYKPIVPNTTTLEAEIGDLEPGILYWLSLDLIIKEKDHVISGHSVKFSTNCTPSTKFKIDANETNLTITDDTEKSVLYRCPFSRYSVIIQTYEIEETICNRNLSEMPFTIKKLEPGTLYKVIISIGNKTLIEKPVSTNDGIPSPVQSIKYNIFNDTNVVLNWDPPKYPKGKIIKYEVTLQVKKYRGCEDLNKSSPPSYILCSNPKETRITFNDLQPYTVYTAKIYAWNSKKGKIALTEFSTNSIEIPRSRFSRLRLDGKELVWDEPKDCSIISGPIPKTKLIFHGVSEAVKNQTVTKQTESRKLSINLSELYGNEKYEVFIYPIRDWKAPHNSTTYLNLEFVTPAKAPPKVRNLEIYEVDTFSKSMSLRWQKPFPPNGKLDHYIVKQCNSIFCPLIKSVPSNEYCPLWDDYICTTINNIIIYDSIIQVFAVNKNIGKGEYANATYNPSELVPDPPENVTAQLNGKNKVLLSWLHPWRTRSPLKKFFIQIEVINTNLTGKLKKKERHRDHEYFINSKSYQRNYTKDFNLFPSTKYKFSVSSVTDKSNGTNNSVSFETPASIAFKGQLTYKIQSEDRICLDIPKIENDTKTSKIDFIVIGKDRCHHIKLNAYFRQRAGIKDDKDAWIETSFPSNKYSGEEFCVGSRTTYVTNCPLKIKDIYIMIMIVQAEQNSKIDDVTIAMKHAGYIPRKNDGIWAVPVVIILIIILGVYVYRRRRQKIPQEVIMHENGPILYKPEKGIFTTSDMTENNHSLCPSTTDIAISPIETDPNNDDLSMPIKVKDFEDYVKNAIKSGLLEKQYEVFPRGPTKPCDYGKLPQNKSKNRYKDLAAYDETRVILKKLHNDPFSDYINANYIKGYKKEKRYVATQGPKANTVIDFWRMVWQEKVLVICMLASLFEHGKSKCEQYWPDIGKKKRYGDVTVFNANHDVFADYTFRILHVQCGDETRQVKHLHYSAWPDHSVPMYTYSVVSYLKKLLATQIGDGPVVVHCSAGVGRTGTIILCDICLRRAADEGVVDVFSETRSIRSQRMNMVDNKQQFLFAHLVLVECLLALPTSLPCNDALPERIRDLKTQLNIQFQRLVDIAWQDEALKPTITRTCLSQRNMAKNRYPELVSKKVSRIFLKKYPLYDDDSDYIAAVRVDGLKVNQYLASQLPLPSTFSDFWRMVAEFKVELIVMLQPPDPNDPTCCPVVPTNGEFKPTPYINVVLRQIVKDEYYVLYKLNLVDKSEKLETEQSITILGSTKYEAGRNKNPPPVIALVKLWQVAVQVSMGDSPTVVLCHDGVTGCGLFLALSFLLERMTIESECDVCLAIRTVKRSRPDFVQSLEQMEYLYNAALIYAEHFYT